MPVFPLIPTLMVPVLAALLTTAQDPEAPASAAADLGEFRTWIREYRDGQHRMIRQGRADDEALARASTLMANLARWDSLEAAKLVFVAASIDPEPPGARSATDRLDFYRELQPWRIRTMARAHLRQLTSPEILPWLLAKLRAKGIRAREVNRDQKDAAAVLRVLAGHDKLEARLALLSACRSMPTQLRVKAAAALARDATLETAPALMDLLRDSEPNVRIAAADALGTALSPHTDETLVEEPTASARQIRDQAIKKLAALLVKDPIWQVRSAGAFALARMKCKAVIEPLIDGLDAELRRKKDPWAMDVRMHRLLEGLTGQTVVRGSIRPWRDFWRKEGPSFAVAKAARPGEQKVTTNRYQKFFNIRIQSDRVLFVLDFSGSMAEPIELTTRTTGAPPGQKTTKAELVVREIERLIMSLPDGALVNLVVFSEGVRVWREEGGRPALIRLDDESRDDLLGSFLPSLRANGPTNLHGALAKALDFGGRGLYDKYYRAGFDTLCVISDGAPTVGEVTDKDEIRRRVREANSLRKIAIHCITFGDSNDTDFLRMLAQENGGRHVHVD